MGIVNIALFFPLCVLCTVVPLVHPRTTTDMADFTTEVSMEGNITGNPTTTQSTLTTTRTPDTTIIEKTDDGENDLLLIIIVAAILVVLIGVVILVIICLVRKKNYRRCPCHKMEISGPKDCEHIDTPQVPDNRDKLQQHKLDVIGTTQETNLRYTPTPQRKKTTSIDMRTGETYTNLADFDKNQQNTESENQDDKQNLIHSQSGESNPMTTQESYINIATFERQISENQGNSSPPTDTGQSSSMFRQESYANIDSVSRAKSENESSTQALIRNESEESTGMPRQEVYTNVATVDRNNKPVHTPRAEKMKGSYNHPQRDSQLSQQQDNIYANLPFYDIPRTAFTRKSSYSGDLHIPARSYARRETDVYVLPVTQDELPKLHPRVFSGDDNGLYIAPVNTNIKPTQNAFKRIDSDLYISPMSNRSVAPPTVEEEQDEYIPPSQCARHIPSMYLHPDLIGNKNTGITLPHVRKRPSANISPETLEQIRKNHADAKQQMAMNNAGNEDDVYMNIQQVAGMARKDTFPGDIIMPKELSLANTQSKSTVSLVRLGRENSLGTLTEANGQSIYMDMTKSSPHKSVQFF